MGKKSELWMILLFLGFGILYLLAAVRYPMGDCLNPGPGLVPTLLALGFIGLSGYLLLARVMHARRRSQGEIEENGLGIKTPLQVVLVLAFYLLVLEPLGFIPCTFLAIWVISRIMGLEGWKKPILLSLGAVGAAFFIFSFLLDVPLPIGKVWGR